MKQYIVQWGSNKEEFEDIREAIGFAEKTGLENKTKINVWVERDGVRDDEPFFTGEWTI